MLHFARIIFLCLLIQSPFALFADDFVDNLDGVPLMKGFEVNLDEGFVFDKPEGRVASASAYGNKSPEQVLTYYQQVLPELGWQAIKPYLFLREGEYLMLETTQEDGFTVILFLNFPKIDGERS